jgi:diphosphomevalonate decarboxylase
MPIFSATAIAHPNIALIKYWGDIDNELHLPANGSISMNLSGLITRTMVSFIPSLEQDQFIFNGEATIGSALERVSAILERVRQLAGISTFARVESINNFPVGAGIASSASGFAALSLAASRSVGLILTEKDLSRLARIGSGSACRSIPGGFVEWQPGHDDSDCFAYSLAPPDYWDVADCIAIVSRTEKLTSSSVGHSIASTSILQPTRVADTPRRLSLCRDAIKRRSFPALAEIVELDSNLMHSVMNTSTPPLFYWHPGTVEIIQAVQTWRKAGLPVCYTIDAGPNVHVLCPGYWEEKIVERLRQLPYVIDILPSHPGGPAMIDKNQPDKVKIDLK